MKNSIFVLPEHLYHFLNTHTQSLINNLEYQEDVEGMPCQDFYGDLVFESLLIHLKPTVEQLTQKKLLPTYSFFRNYVKGSVLPNHVDRPSCEYSTTICLGSSNPNIPWTIYIEDTPVDLKMGQGIVYKGCEQSHYRKACPHDNSAHVFLHYVDADGENSKYIYDERESLYRPTVQPDKRKGKI